MPLPPVAASFCEYAIPTVQPGRLLVVMTSVLLDPSGLFPSTPPVSALPSTPPSL
jgi:hypothetical protein